MHPHISQSRYGFFIKPWWSHVKHDGGRSLLAHVFYAQRRWMWMRHVEADITHDVCSISWYSRSSPGQIPALTCRVCRLVVSWPSGRLRLNSVFKYYIHRIFLLFRIKGGHVFLCAWFLENLYNLSMHPGSNYIYIFLGTFPSWCIH